MYLCPTLTPLLTLYVSLSNVNPFTNTVCIFVIQLYEPNDVIEGTSDDSYASIKDLSTLKDRFRTLDSFDDMDMFDSPPAMNDESSEIIEGGVRKRPFCNGFTGCGRISGKRTSSNSLLLNSLRLSDSLHEAKPASSARSKRPFCNGFYGCGNPGKRIVIRHTYRQPGSMLQIPNRRSACGPLGCRSEDSLFNHPWIQRMRTLLSQKA